MTDRYEQRMYINDVLARSEERTAARLAASTAPSDQPADLLAAAAQRLRDLATATTTHGSAHWIYTQRHDHPEYGGFGTVRTQDGKVVTGGGPARGGRRVPNVVRPYGEWIATMDPTLGLLIAHWLDDEAEFQQHAAAGPEDSEHALDFARAVLGQNGGQQ
ncbi:hypothetical protein [Kitasatospora aureofaciens]|uniref:hypothetical protein n=1 Tax=Kitasatospora aureofaciens TaxID=1894 RepID=UPI0033DC91EC